MREMLAAFSALGQVDGGLNSKWRKPIFWFNYFNISDEPDLSRDNLVNAKFSSFDRLDMYILIFL